MKIYEKKVFFNENQSVMERTKEKKVELMRRQCQNQKKISV